MKDNLKLYYVDMKYIRDLHNVDSHVASVSPQTGKEDRPFIGIITIVDNKKYCIPLTSGNKEKFKNKKNSVDFIKIPDEGKKNSHGAYITIGGLNINNMIPVDDSVLIPIDIKIHSMDTGKQISDKKRLTKELDWCQRNEDLITRKAKRLYSLRVQHPRDNISLTKRCCDFKKLEAVLEKRLRKETTKSEQKTSRSQPKKQATYSVSALKQRAKEIHNTPHRSPTQSKNKKQGLE